CVLGSPFYLRNALERHNPVFPMAYEVFGGVGWDDVRAEAYWRTLREYGAGEGLSALTAAVRVLFARDFRHGFEGSIGPVFALGMVAGGWLLVRPPEGVPRRPLALVVATLAGFLVLFTATVAQARFFLVAAPLLAALLAVGGDALVRERARPFVRAGLCAACAAWGAAGYVHLWTRQPTWAWLRGRLSVDVALAAQLPESYAAMRALEALVPP